MKYLKIYENFSFGKLKLLYQDDGISCGPASLKMIADYLNIKVSLSELRIIMGTDKFTGTTDIKMKKGLDYISLDYKQFHVGKSMESYEMLDDCFNKDGVVLFRTLTKGIKHWICCDYKNEKNEYHILDPWLGEYFLNKDDLENVWSPRDYDGFVIFGIKKIQLGDIKISKIEKDEIDEVVDQAAIIFTNVMGYKANISYMKTATDFSKSVKLTNNGELIGCYLVHDIELRKLSNKKGIEGVALAIKPAYRKYGLGEKLKNWLEEYAKENNYDFIFGQHLKGLDNIDYWLKRRDLYKETKNMYYTIKYIK